jgi:hypothetical protein
MAAPAYRRRWLEDARRRLMQEDGPTDAADGGAPPSASPPPGTSPEPEGAAERCGADTDPGPCGAVEYAWYFDPRRGACRRFAYSGCGGNANRFGSAADCRAACAAPGAAAAAVAPLGAAVPNVATAT